MTKKERTKWVIALAVAVSGVWLMGVAYVLSYKPEVYVNPGTVTTNVPAIYSPESTPIKVYTPIRSLSRFRASYSVSTLRHSHMPSLPMQSIGRIYTTSSAQVHSVGGGGNGGVYTTSHGNTSSRGIQYSEGGNAAMPQTNFIAMASSRQMAAPEASYAPQMARLASGPNNAPPGPPNPPGDDGPLPGDHQLVEQPVGDALLELALLALAYALARTYKKRAKKTTA
ncbi:MAG: hypothetical protein II605_02295 [Paludibacteraceae bacterium]|nr:hypothetical protein [Paludibacteraceae bacterium]MBQ2520964.1 hypothetical protein [Paludibacteraceae bacterium]MBQ4018054.1 hypothetical protein [Paludibacteraceae bacterium]MBQ5378741.1 hypothetical protein [Paludibacteraceae bacterium]